MTVLVFGGSSQIGHYLLPLLAARDEPVLAVSRAAHAPAQNVTWLAGRLPDAVPMVEDISAIFSFGPLNHLADWLQQAELPHAPRVVAVSSMSADSKRDSEVGTERELSQLIRDSEAALANACEKHGSAWTVLRPTLVYGAGMDKSLTPMAQRAMRTRAPQPAGRYAASAAAGLVAAHRAPQRGQAARTAEPTGRGSHCRQYGSDAAAGRAAAPVSPRRRLLARSRVGWGANPNIAICMHP